MPSRSSSRIDPLRGLRGSAHGSHGRCDQRAHEHDLADGRREIPVDGLELRHPARRDACAPDARLVVGRRSRGHRTRGTLPDDRPQQGGLAGTGRPDDADERATVDRQVDVAQDRLAVVPGADVLEPDQRRWSPSSPASRCPSTAYASNDRGIAAQRLDHDLHVLLEHAVVGVLGATSRRRAARRRSARPRMSRRTRGRSAPAPGSGRPPSRRPPAPARPGSGRSAGRPPAGWDR